jgi:putative lipoprotein (rSAM/lipoprotein system)
MERFELWLMRVLGSLLGLAVMGCAGGAPAYGAIPTYGMPTASYKVGGMVTDAATGLPIQGIQVTFQGGTATTAADGTFSLTWTGFYCTACPVTAADVDGAQHGAYGPATVPLNLAQTGPGDGKWFYGNFEQEGVAIQMAAKP